MPIKASVVTSVLFCLVLKSITSIVTQTISHTYKYSQSHDECLQMQAGYICVDKPTAYALTYNFTYSSGYVYSQNQPLTCNFTNSSGYVCSTKNLPLTYNFTNSSEKPHSLAQLVNCTPQSKGSIVKLILILDPLNTLVFVSVETFSFSRSSSCC